MRAKSSTFTICVVVATLAVAVTHAPHSTSADQITAPSTPGKKYQRTGDEGMIGGTISFIGRPPRRKFISMAADAVCDRLNPSARAEDVMIRHGKIANVFVYVKSAALEGLEFEPPQTKAVLERRRCRDVPHVLGLQTGQTLSVRNRDATPHNLNIHAIKNERVNITSLPGAAPFLKTFSRAEQFIPLRCNQHPWEKAYLGIFDHPFFAVSNRRGTYAIRNLPPGTYTLVAWHERFGEQSLEVEVRARGYQKKDFKFKGPPEN